MLTCWCVRCRFFVLTLLVVGSACNRGASDQSAPPFSLEATGSTFEQIDRNGDGKLGLEAFHKGLSVHYYFRQGLDLDGDEVVLHVELTTAFFELWDSDDDGSLTTDEWVRGLRIWLPDRSATARFEEWDLDDDQALSIVELGEGTLRSKIYDAYDANEDGVIETREISEYLHARWDANDDGFVELSEWPLP